ncbi:hypothetical protein HPP92_025490 [Vanilla planifolia]|uniref:Protein kinase domain-containing protein n=1 Tax=Vanilla planifolia TaxID=51239 RepID=A0A835PL45_VANPL|nr:hypothetical protein HPP92_025490 [Vanilla planifolia]
MRRSDSRTLKIEGTRGYIAPEIMAGGCVSRNSDVFALGVVLLELISGEEPLKYRLPEKGGTAFEWVSLIETARKVIGPAEEAGERMGRVRRWVDRRLRDSFPVEVVEKLTLVALRCVETEAARRPSMSWVEGMISKLFLESKDWSERVRFQADISASFAPR